MAREWWQSTEAAPWAPISCCNEEAGFREADRVLQHPRASESGEPAESSSVDRAAWPWVTVGRGKSQAQVTSQGGS